MRGMIVAGARACGVRKPGWSEHKDLPIDSGGGKRYALRRIAAPRAQQPRDHVYAPHKDVAHDAGGHDSPSAGSRAQGAEPRRGSQARLGACRASVSGSSSTREKLSIPAQQRLGLYKERAPTRARKKTAPSGQEDSILSAKLRPPGLAAKNIKLMAQHDDLKLLELRRAPASAGAASRARAGDRAPDR